MTADAGFLAEIIAHPEDDTPRLIYADWLEEQGQVERAEFIRVQCAAHHLEFGSGKHADHPKAAQNCVLCAKLTALRRRERYFLGEPQFGWFAAVAGLLKSWGHKGSGGKSVYVVWESPTSGGPVRIKGTFRRGFVDSVECGAGDWLQHGNAILDQHPVTKVLLSWAGRTTALERDEQPDEKPDEWRSRLMSVAHTFRRREEEVAER